MVPVFYTHKAKFKARPMKKKQKDTHAFKKIIRRQQKRKDGKKRYYYVNETDGGIVSRDAWAKNKDIEKKFQSVYGKKRGKEAYKEAVKEVKKEEKRFTKKEKQTAENEVSEYLDKHGYPKRLASFVNQSALSSLTSKVLEGRTVVLELDGSFFLVSDNDILEFKYFFDELLTFFFEKVREIYGKKKNSNATPMLLTPWLRFSGGKLVNIEGTSLLNIRSNEDFRLNFGKSDMAKQRTVINKIKSLFNDYLSGLKKIDLVKFILKNSHNGSKY
jgi:hypothetical protein